MFCALPISEHLLILQTKSINFAVETIESDTNWHRYDIQIYLGKDTPQNPIREKACLALINYEFTPPEVMRVYFDKAVPPNERNLSLNTRFLFLRFQWGGRISNIFDESQQTENGTVHIHGISYQTLEGHFEQGQLTSEIWKYQATGDVYFRLHAYSRVGQIKNPIYRLFFPVSLKFIRPYFIWRALRRMRRLVNSF